VAGISLVDVRITISCQAFKEKDAFRASGQSKACVFLFHFSKSISHVIMTSRAIAG
jgi:hypothetical protein